MSIHDKFIRFMSGLLCVSVFVQSLFVLNVFAAKPLAFCIIEVNGSFSCNHTDSYNDADINNTCFLGNEEALARCKRALQTGLRWNSNAYKFTSNGNGMTGAEAGAYYHNEISKKEKKKKIQDYVTVAGGVIAAAGLAMTVGAAIGVKNNDSLKGALIGSGIGMITAGGVTAYIANSRSKNTAKDLRTLKFAQQDNVDNMLNTEYVQNQFKNNTYSGYNGTVKRATVRGLDGRNYYRTDTGDLRVSNGNGDTSTGPETERPGTSGPSSGEVTGPCGKGGKPCDRCYNDKDPICNNPGLNSNDNCKRIENATISNGGNITHILNAFIWGILSADDCCKKAAQIQGKDFSTYKGHDNLKGCLWGDKVMQSSGWDIVGGICVECINGKTKEGKNCEIKFKTEEECLNDNFMGYAIDYWHYDKDGNCIHYSDILKLPYGLTEEAKRNAKLKLFKEKNYFETQSECFEFYRKADKWICCKKTAAVSGFPASNKPNFYLINYCNTLVADCSGRFECHYDRLGNYDPTKVETLGESQCSGASRYSESSALRDLKISIARFK